MAPGYVGWLVKIDIITFHPSFLAPSLYSLFPLLPSSIIPSFFLSLSSSLWQLPSSSHCLSPYSWLFSPSLPPSPSPSLPLSLFPLSSSLSPSHSGNYLLPLTAYHRIAGYFRGTIFLQIRMANKSKFTRKKILRIYTTFTCVLL